MYVTFEFLISPFAQKRCAGPICLTRLWLVVFTQEKCMQPAYLSSGLRTPDQSWTCHANVAYKSSNKRTALLEHPHPKLYFFTSSTTVDLNMISRTSDYCRTTVLVEMTS
jgi:hypothetical protein